MLKLNIGAGGDLKKDYINIDLHSKEEIELRYGLKLDPSIQVEKLNILNLPYNNESVDEILCLGFLEHLSFEHEGRFLKEVFRTLKKNAVFHFTVPDFENLLKQWLSADDQFLEFYKTGTEEHWFGNYNRNINNRWGYLTASIFGNQNGEGQFHRNAYTKQKIARIMKILKFSSHKITTSYFKDTQILMLECVAKK